MNRITNIALATAFAMLAVACAGDPDEPIYLPEITIPEVSTTASEATPETTTPEVSTTVPEATPETTTPEVSTTVPEATPDTTTPETTTPETTTTVGEETPETTTTAAEVTPETTTTVGEETPEQTATEDETVGTEQSIAPDRVVVREGVASEKQCLVSGGAWVDGQCTANIYDNPEDAGVSVYWYPRLMDDAYDSVDPDMVEADHSESLDTRGPWGVHNYHVFYHYNDFGDPQVQYETMREAMSYGVRSVFVYATDWVWFPYRYDISWSDVPNVVAVTGTYPLGEQRTLLLPVDPQQRGTPNVELPLPLPPPIRPTTPFTQPRWTQVAEALGSNCPPVEEIWDGYGTEVTDPCTLKAVETAVDWAWRADGELRGNAIRDGLALADFFLELDNFEDPHENALLGYESRVGGAILVKDIKWAGQWPGASMISLEWNLNYPSREFTPEEKEAKNRYIAALIDLGYDVSGDYMRDDLTLGEVFWDWVGALIVRTQDGTWKMSQRSICWWYEKFIRIDQEELLCPEDPNPHFPDSAFFDHDIYPPSHKTYYQDPRASTSFLPHHDRGTPRRTGEYLGVPPS